MKHETIEISSIVVENRQRQDLGDLDSLAESIKRYGLIQPIIVDQTRRLIAGGRRLAATASTGATHINVVYRETLTEDELHELELEENLRRKDLTWVEWCKCVATIHRLKVRRNALESKSWGHRETAELLNIKGSSNISYTLRVAKELEDERDKDGNLKSVHPFHDCETFSDAWRLIMRNEGDRVSAELTRRARENATLGASETDSKELISYVNLLSSSEVALENERTRYYSNSHNPPGSFESYIEEKRQQKTTAENTVYLSNKFFLGKSEVFMTLDENHERFDHIVTDPPYAIDMEMLNQQNPHGSMVDIDTVVAEHDVEQNKSLFQAFFPAAFKCLKPSGFCITWCDQTLWQYMYDLAVSAGFKVQRWPITWNKTSRCMNQTAQYNFTKSTEIAMVCRKGGATLMRPQPTCVITAGRDELCASINHPFAKPFTIWQFLIEAVSIEGQLILEPFAGQGSGVLSLLRLKRNFIACELNETHMNHLQENVKRLHYLPINKDFVFK